MKIKTMIWIVALAGSMAPAVERTVAVYVDNRSGVPLAVFSRAQRMTGTMFEAIGVRLIWRFRAPVSDPGEVQPIVLTLTNHRPADYQRRAVACAQPFEGIHLEIMYNRLKWSESRPNLASALLAQVMAHEITHLLQGINRHSSAGVMKAHLTNADFDAIQQKPLSFEPYDVGLIHQGIDLRALPPKTDH
jgi:hypothetical protein